MKFLQHLYCVISVLMSQASTLPGAPEPSSAKCARAAAAAAGDCGGTCRSPRGVRWYPSGVASTCPRTLLSQPTGVAHYAQFVLAGMLGKQCMHGSCCLPIR